MKPYTLLEKAKANLLPLTAIGAAVGFSALIALTPESEARYNPQQPGEIVELYEEPTTRDDFYLNGVYMGRNIPARMLLNQCAVYTNGDVPLCDTATVHLPEDYRPGTYELGDHIVIAELDYDK